MERVCGEGVLREEEGLPRPPRLSPGPSSRSSLDSPTAVPRQRKGKGKDKRRVQGYAEKRVYRQRGIQRKG